MKKTKSADETEEEFWLSERLEELKEKKRVHDGEDMTVYNKEIALSMGYTEYEFSRIKNGNAQLTYDFLIELANYFDLTIDEVLTDDCKNALVYRYIPLHDKALAWLNETHQEDSQLVRMLDIILSNKEVADKLLGALLVYAEDPMFKIHTLNSEVPPEAIDSESSQAITKALCLQYIAEAMDVIKDDWKKAYIENDDLLEKAMERLFMSDEGKRRVRYKIRADRKGKIDKRITAMSKSGKGK